MRDHPVAAVIGLLIVCYHLAAMTTAFLDAREGRDKDDEDAH